MQDIARDLEKATPGSIHEIRFTFSGRRLHASVVFDRNRGSGTHSDAAQQNSSADGAPPSQGRNGGRNAGTPAQRTTSAREQQGPSRPNQAPLGAAQPLPRPDNASVAAGRQRPTTGAALTKYDMLRIEGTIKGGITPIVREMGGSEQDGARHLTPSRRRHSGSRQAASGRGPSRSPLAAS